MDGLGERASVLWDVLWGRSEQDDTVETTGAGGRPMEEFDALRARLIGCLRGDVSHDNRQELAEECAQEARSRRMPLARRSACAPAWSTGDHRGVSSYLAALAFHSREAEMMSQPLMTPASGGDRWRHRLPCASPLQHRLPLGAEVPGGRRTCSRAAVVSVTATLTSFASPSRAAAGSNLIKAHAR